MSKDAAVALERAVVEVPVRRCDMPDQLVELAPVLPVTEAARGRANVDVADIQEAGIDLAKRAKELLGTAAEKSEEASTDVCMP